MAHNLRTSLQDIRARLPDGWSLETQLVPDRCAVRVLLWREVDQSHLESTDSASRTLLRLVEGALYDTLAVWQGAQPMPDRYWAS